jgi:hypothetical protein
VRILGTIAMLLPIFVLVSFSKSVATAEVISGVPLSVYVLSHNDTKSRVKIKGKVHTIERKQLRACKTVPGYCQARLDLETYQKIRERR